MKIVLTGGGSGGHFYPLIAVAQEIHSIVEERKLFEPELIYIGPKPFDAQALLEQGIEHRQSPAGKIRNTDGKIRNFFDIFRTFVGIVKATFQLFAIYPDVVFSKGGYAAFPTLFAARILKIPVIIHESDAVPGRVNLWSSKFAIKIATSYPLAADRFPKRVRAKIALVGNPIRRIAKTVALEGGHEFLKTDPNVPTIFVMGGSQGAVAINDVILKSLPMLLEKYNIIHQVGKANIEEVKGVAKTVLKDIKHDERYRVFGLLNTFAMRAVAGISSLIISRAGSGAIFEIASWGIPSILIPIPQDISRDQTKNAFAYARTGAAIVLKQRNVHEHILLSEINRIMNDENSYRKMSVAAKTFAMPNAANKLANIIIKTALKHTE